VKIETVVVLLLIGFIYLVSHTDRADAIVNSINQNASIEMENQSELVPWLGFQGEGSLTFGGILITGITPGGPAADAGIMEGDLIIKADNKSVNNTEQIRMNTTIGQVVNFTLLRNNLEGTQQMDISLKVAARPAPKYEEASIYSEPDNVNFSSYEDIIQSQYMTMDYPTSWNITTEDGAYTFRSLREDSNDSSREYLRLVILPSWEQTIDELISVKQPLQDLNITKPLNSTIDDNHARELEYTYSDDTNGELKAMKVATEIENTTFLFSYQAQASKYDTYWPTIERMIDSFETLSILDYENLDMGIRVKYPSNWNKSDKPYSRTPFVEDVPSVYFHPTDKPQPSNEIRISSVPAMRTLDEEVNQTIRDYTDTRPLFELLENPINITLSSLPFRILNYSYSDGLGGYINATEYLTKANDTAYSFSYSAEENDFPKYRKSFNSIIDSFETIERPPIPFFDRDLGIMLEYPYPDVKELQRTDTNVTFSFPKSLAIDEPRIILTVSNSSDQGGSGSGRDQAESNKNTILNTTLGTHLRAEKTVVNVTKELIGLFQFLPNQTVNQTVMQINSAPLLNNLDNRKYSYNITFIADTDEYEKYLPIVEQIISTMKIVDYESMGSNLSNHTFSDYGFKLKYPSNWQYEDYGSGFVNFYPPNQNSSSYNSSIEFSVSPPINESMFDIVKEDIETLSQPQQPNSDSTSFSLIDSEVRTEDGYPIYRIQYALTGDYQNTMTNQWYIQNANNSNLYFISYQADKNEFYSFLPVTEQIIKSMDFIPVSKERTFTGFKIGDSPTGIATNSKTNISYVANRLSNTISVINDSSDQVISNIRVKGEPWVVAVNDLKNIIYVTHPGFLSLIAGNNNTLVSGIPIGAESPISMAINPKSNRIYVADDISKNVTVIDSRINKVVDIIPTINSSEYGSESVLRSGVGVSVDPLRDKLYSVNNLDGKITVIDGKNNRIIEKIPIESYTNSSEISVNPYTNKAYLTGNTFSSEVTSDVYEIDLSTKLSRLLNESGISFNTIAINPFMNTVYVTDSYSNKILAIDPIQGNSTEITVDSGPTFMSVNPKTNVIYVTNSNDDTISKIDGSTNSLLYGVRFKINPPSSAFIMCSNAGNTMKLYDNDYVVYKNGTSLKCDAKPQSSFYPLLSSSWSGLDAEAPVEFLVTEYGTLNGSFLDFTTLIQTIGPYISYAVLIAVIVVAIFPSFLGRFRKISDFVGEEKLTRTEIVGIDASIIVGVLFFLTISEGFNISEQTQITLVTVNIIFPFAISAILAVIKQDKEYATRLMIAGFINLIISVILISLMRL
jgi:YVTN family beta-propeller protein